MRIAEGLGPRLHRPALKPARLLFFEHRRNSVRDRLLLFISELVAARWHELRAQPYWLETWPHSAPLRCAAPLRPSAALLHSPRRPLRRPLRRSAAPLHCTAPLSRSPQAAPLHRSPATLPCATQPPRPFPGPLCCASPPPCADPSCPLRRFPSTTLLRRSPARPPCAGSLRNSCAPLALAARIRHSPGGHRMASRDQPRTPRLDTTEDQQKALTFMGTSMLHHTPTKPLRSGRPRSQSTAANTPGTNAAVAKSAHVAAKKGDPRAATRMSTLGRREKLRERLGASRVSEPHEREVVFPAPTGLVATGRGAAPRPLATLCADDAGGHQPRYATTAAGAWRSWAPPLFRPPRLEGGGATIHCGIGRPAGALAMPRGVLAMSLAAPRPPGATGPKRCKAPANAANGHPSNHTPQTPPTSISQAALLGRFSETG